MSMRTNEHKTAVTEDFDSAAGRSLVQRKCACGGAIGFAQECSACQDAKSGSRLDAHTFAAGNLPPTVLGGLDSSHQPLDRVSRSVVEPRSGHDFSYMRVHRNNSSGGRMLPAAVRAEAENRLQQPMDHVRLHDDTAGGWTALSFGARAVTFGNHIYVAPGQLEVNGSSLLMHEVAHVASQEPSLGMQKGVAPRSHPTEQFARDFAAGHTSVPPTVPVGLYRDPMLREDFDRQIRRFGITRVFTGTFDEQVQRLNYFGAGTQPGNLLQRDVWTAWDPGSDSDVYDWIIAAFSSLATSLGGVPAVQDIAFFATDYNVNRAGALVPNGDVLAAYGGGHMAIYKSAVTRATMVERPTGRSTAGAPAAGHLSAEAGVRETITHELGHGIVETALTPRGASAPDLAFMTDYRREVGWTDGAAPQLFDAGVAEVRAALAANTPPPAAYRITEDNWNDARWVEQPISSYMTTHPSEDLPEAIAAFVNTPDLLRQRSQRRFNFLNTRKAALAPFLKRDLSGVRLFPTDEELRRIIGQPAPNWLQAPPPALPPTTSEPAVRLREGPVLEIRF